MSITGRSLPAQGSSFDKAWLVVAAAMLAIATVVALAVFAPRSTTAGSSNHSAPSVGKVIGRAPVQPELPIWVNGQVCGQCR